MAINFPYPNMQQLNLDWLLEKFAVTLVGVQLPATPYANLTDIIDARMTDIPLGPSLLVFGDAANDPITQCCIAVCFKKSSSYCFCRFWGWLNYTKAGYKDENGWTLT